MGEFAELGFEVRITFAADGAAGGAHAAWDAFLCEVIEGNGLLLGGGGSGLVHRGFVTCSRWRSSLTEARREVVRRWLADHPLVRGFEVGPLVDAWNG